MIGSGNDNNEISHDNIQYYPNKPSIDNTLDDITISTNQLNIKSTSNRHDIWSNSNLLYTTTNIWKKIPKETKEKCRSHHIDGVEIRLLDDSHFLRGEYGLFATKRFSRFDIIGEYTGRIVDCKTGGHYVAALENKDTTESLGIDAQIHGNEMRFINSYMNIEFQPNVAMRTVYIETYPHVVIVCIDTIDIGDELLLDYGEDYNKTFLLKPKINYVNIPIDVMRKALPGYDSDSSRDSSDTDTDNKN